MPARRQQNMREVIRDRLLILFQTGITYIYNLVSAMFGVNPAQHVNPQKEQANPLKSGESTHSSSSTATDTPSTTPGLSASPAEPQPSFFQTIYENRNEFAQLLFGGYAAYQSMQDPVFARAAAVAAWQHFTSTPTPESAGRSSAPRPGGRNRGESVD